MSITPEGSVVISPMMMYQRLLALSDDMRDVKGLLDPSLKEVRHDLADHETRIRGLEKRLWMASGAALFLSTIATLLIRHYKW